MSPISMSSMNFHIDTILSRATYKMWDIKHYFTEKQYKIQQTNITVNLRFTVHTAQWFLSAEH